jgi:hypothetical protein
LANKYSFPSALGLHSAAKIFNHSFLLREGMGGEILLERNGAGDHGLGLRSSGPSGKRADIGYFGKFGIVVSWAVRKDGEMMGARHRLILLPETLAICRLETTASIPDWATLGRFWSITRTEEELSVVCPEAHVPPDVKRETGWRVLKVEGPLDFSLTGILASLTVPLAEEKVSVFAISTYDTDYLLVKEEQLEKAIRALGGEGYEIKESSEFGVGSSE